MVGFKMDVWFFSRKQKQIRPLRVGISSSYLQYPRALGGSNKQIHSLFHSLYSIALEPRIGGIYFLDPPKWSGYRRASNDDRT